MSFFLSCAMIFCMKCDGMTIQMMGDPGSTNAEMAPIYLHKLIRRLSLAVMGIKGQCLQTAWWCHGTDKFDIEV